jgi:fructose-1,6-bisphosphatase
LAQIVETAGGCASTGRQRIAEITPTSLHQRVPVVLGSREDVQRYERFAAGQGA